MILSGFMDFLLILNHCDGCMCINKSKKILQIHGADKLEQAVSQRPEGQSLITVLLMLYYHLLFIICISAHIFYLAKTDITVPKCL
jgi:hypothetical protein